METKLFYETPLTEVITISVDTAVMQASSANGEIPDLGVADGVGDITWDFML